LDHGLKNSYRMGAEGKYDLKLANPEQVGFDLATPGTSKKQNVLTSRKSISTPSLPEATDGFKVDIFLSLKIKLFINNQYFYLQNFSQSEKRFKKIIFSDWLIFGF
jgi:hypothetical protein